MSLQAYSKLLIGTTIRGKILSYLEEKNYPVPPKEIAQKLNINTNSVRPTLISLLREGKISRPNRGYYITKLIHGVEDILPRVHNLVLYLKPYHLEGKIQDYDGCLFGSCLRIQFGFKCQRVKLLNSHSSLYHIRKTEMLQSLLPWSAFSWV